jgi:hypothetical protein
MDGVTTRPLRLTGNPGGQIGIPMNTRLTVSDWLGKQMIDRGMLEEIKTDIIQQEKRKSKKGEEKPF